MSKPTQTALLTLAGITVIAAATPTLTKLIGALVPLVLVLGGVIAVLRIVWAITRRW
jgi:hypothetical protein